MKTITSFLSVPLAGVLLALLHPATLCADYQSVVLGDGPTGFWRLNEPPQPGPQQAMNIGSLAPTGNGAFYTVTQNQPGAIVGDTDGAVTFSGASPSKIDVAYQAELNPATFTVECWVNPAATQATHADILGNHAGGGPSGFALQQDGDAWVNAAWGKTEIQVRMKVEGGIGEVDIEAVSAESI